MIVPNLSEEKKLWKAGYKAVAGLDEAGRGPLAGPVVAAAVIIQNTKYEIQNTKIRDSKELSPKARGKFYKILTAHPAVSWGIGVVSEKVIDKINIKNAAELAMERAIENLKAKSVKRKTKPDFLIIDGNHIKNLKLKTISHKLIVGADARVFSCAAASILAKVARDRIMLKYHKRYPGYGFDKHNGYPTRHHKAMLKLRGPCVIHRRTFAPLQALYNE